MKAISLIVSLAVFVVSGYFLVRDFSYSIETNYLIYMSLLVILMLICVVGVLINMALILKGRRKLKVIIYGKIMGREIKTNDFEIGLETS